MKIVRIWDVEPTILEGGGRTRRMITRKRVGAEKLSLGVVFLDPGQGHNWHSHPAGEEEAYYIVKGKGKLAWEQDGKIVSQEVTEGDAVFTPPTGIKNQIINTGAEPLMLVWSISPPKE